MYADNKNTPLTIADRTELRNAASLLAESLRGRAELSTIDTPGKADGRAVIVEVRSIQYQGASGKQPKPARLRLVSYDPADPIPTKINKPSSVEAVLVVRRGTAKFRQSLREHGVSFVDLSGAAHIRLPWLLVDRTDLPKRHVPVSNGPSPVDPFGDNNSRVVRTLLDAQLRNTEPKTWGVRELAAVSGVDRTTTSKILRRLAAWNVIRLERRGRSVAAGPVEPIQLVDRWSASYDWTENGTLSVHAPIGDPRRFLTRLPSSFPKTLRWALTLQAGASLLAPHAVWDRVHIYVDVIDPGQLHDIAAAADWRPGDDGNLVLVRPFYRKTIWENTQRVKELPVVSLPQLLVDLWRYPLRGREQAEHLIEISHRLHISATVLSSDKRNSTNQP